MEILYEDDSIIVVNKPSGLAVQTSRLSEKCLETELKKYRKQKGEKPEIYIVHRLDQPVNGLMVLAKTETAASKLSKDLQKDFFTKEYKARVYKTELIPQEKHLEDFMVKDSSGNVSKICKEKDSGAKKAVLDFKVLSETDFEAELFVHLQTGRFHQIRLQLSNAGFPILGDLKYGTEESKKYSAKNGIKNVALTAFRLEFVHPVTNKKMEFELN